ncbi:MAG TPA: hypothetical protein VMK12_05590 [Anaeromyxobacteraceae bacterium]|nr:hypothetical protein [Anaeromyxobacteraceae bacterium]
MNEIGKALHERCRHLREAGCGVYDARPASCRAFFCHWVRSGGAEPERPDLSGVMLEPAEVSARGTGIVPFAAYETRPGGLDGYWGQKILKRVARRALVGLIPYGGEEPREFIGPPGQVLAGIEWKRR